MKPKILLFLLFFVAIISACAVQRSGPSASSSPVSSTPPIPTLFFGSTPSGIETPRTFPSTTRLLSSDSNLSTPELIQRAYDLGEITDEERMLYLTYALGTTGKLPPQYESSIPWDGTSILLDLHKAVNDPIIMCRLSSTAQSELRQLLGTGVHC